MTKLSEKSSLQEIENFLQYLVKAGNSAPSWYNSQPWIFKIKPHEAIIELFLNKDRDYSLYDWGHFNSLLSCGAVIQNIILAAKSFGIQSEITLASHFSDKNLVASIKCNLSQLDSTNIELQKLEKMIWLRHTNTLLYRPYQLSESQINELIESVFEFKDISLHFFQDENSKKEIFEIVSKVECIRYWRKDLHLQLYKMIRWSNKEANQNKTGWTLASMGVCGFGKVLFRVIKSWKVMSLLNIFGMYNHLSERTNSGLLHCSAIGLISLNKLNDQTLIQAGMGLEKLWLVATQLGLNLQPQNAMIQFFYIDQMGGENKFSLKEKKIIKEARSNFNSFFPRKHQTAAFLFRIGKGEESLGKTLRQDLF